METNHKAHKGWLTKILQTPIGGYNTYQIYQGPHELEKAWVSCQGYGNKILILENGEKLMEYGLETKAPIFLVD